MRKDFHILRDFLFRYLSIDLGRFDIGMPHPANSFNRNSL